jgi:hypothetical protein
MNRIAAGGGEIETIKIGEITLAPMAALETFLERRKLAPR